MIANVLDMYHGDDNELLPDFTALLNAGIIAVALKATQGSEYIDPTFFGRSAAANKAGMPVIAYHFGDASSVQDQIKNFMLACAETKILTLWQALDFEHNPKSQMNVGQAVKFMAGTASFILYGSDLVRENAKALFLQGTWLWLAEYGPKENVPSPWTKATTLLWQFSETGIEGGIKGHVDLNYFDGNAAKLAAIWGKPCSIPSSKPS